MKDILKAVVIGGLFAVPFLTLYVENNYFFPFITGKNFWFRIIVDVTFAAWVLLALYDAKYRPKLSWIALGFGTLLIVMFFANLFGVNPRSSFWSNFERMDGYVSLVHTFLYMIVLGSVMATKVLWQRLLNVSLGVAFLVALYGLAQYTGVIQGSDRIDSRLGNAAYMAIYMLFHIFFAFWLFVETKKPSFKIAYVLLTLMFIFVLIETGTRGTAVGLAVGIGVMAAYIGLFGSQFKEFRKYALGALAVLIIVGTGFVLGRDSEFIQSNQNFARIANISFNDLTIRATIWGGGIEGVKERPFLGYGQSNFNYVFNENYDPALYAQEQWFDRAHNIFIDWLTTGGVLGLLAYLSIFFACLYYLFIRPLMMKDESFTVLERGILLGILAGYFTHNLVVFDNIVSYIFFAIVLGLIHARVATPVKKLETVKVDEAMIAQFATPVMAVVLVAVIYFAHVPGMTAAGEIIKAFRSSDPTVRLEYFEKALAADSFAHQEITEQLSQQTMSIVRSQEVPAELKERYVAVTEENLVKLIAEKPGDARVHVFVGSYYRAINQLDKAKEQMQIAHELSPLKQSIMFQQGFIEMAQNNNEAALGIFKTAYELDTRNLEAKEYYAALLIANGKKEEAIALMDSPETKARFSRSDFLIGNANQAGMTDFLIELFTERTMEAPSVGQSWATLAFLYVQKQDLETAKRILNEGKVAAPGIAPLAECVIDNIDNNRKPDEGC